MTEHQFLKLLHDLECEVVRRFKLNGLSSRSLERNRCERREMSQACAVKGKDLSFAPQEAAESSAYVLDDRMSDVGTSYQKNRASHERKRQ
jgi:hypothetical protein